MGKEKEKQERVEIFNQRTTSHAPLPSLSTSLWFQVFLHAARRRNALVPSLFPPSPSSRRQISSTRMFRTIDFSTFHRHLATKLSMVLTLSPHFTSALSTPTTFHSIIPNRRIRPSTLHFSLRLSFPISSPPHILNFKCRNFPKGCSFTRISTISLISSHDNYTRQRITENLY